MKKEIMFGIVGLVIGVIGILLLSPSNQNRGMMLEKNNSVNQESSTSSTKTGMMNNIDKHFIEQMIPHHEGAVDMAELALIKATRPEIKVLARAIIEDQNKEIKDMQTWYSNWFGKNVSKSNTEMMGGGMMSGDGMHMGGQEDMQNLENAVDFDKAFIEGMIPHHQLAVMMAEMLKSGTNRPEMLSLADNIIKSQTKEIKDMQTWYDNWYK
jgi:uncharacterized protein (DUF305 family)